MPYDEQKAKEGKQKQHREEIRLPSLDAFPLLSLIVTSCVVNGRGQVPVEVPVEGHF